MPRLRVNGVELYHESRGQGAETILFSHGLLFSGRMFDPQVAHFAGRYRCVTYDHRGQGRSEAPPGVHDMETVTADALGLIEALKLGPCHFVGLSMGGFVGMRIAARRPELLRSLTLLETSADPERHRFRYAMLAGLMRLFGIGSVVDRIMPILFGAEFLGDPARAAERDAWRESLRALDPRVLAAVRGVITRRGVLDEIAAIRLPTLILVGEQDAATPAVLAQRIHSRIPGSSLQVLPGAGHSSTIEQPQRVNAALERFLASVASCASGSH